jgi:YbbR domain-containing protein
VLDYSIAIRALLTKTRSMLHSFKRRMRFKIVTDLVNKDKNDSFNVHSPRDVPNVSGSSVVPRSATMTMISMPRQKKS